MKLIGRPLTRESCTSFQSLSVWFSTIAQPCNFPSPGSGSAFPSPFPPAPPPPPPPPPFSPPRSNPYPLLPCPLLLPEDQPIARLPDWRLDDVADPHPSFSVAAEIDRDRLFVLPARLRDGREGLLQLVAKLWVFDLYVG